MLYGLSKALDWAENTFALIGGALLVFSMFSIAAEVISRYFFNYSLIWVNEISEYILLYIPFTGAAWLLRQKGHVTVDLIDQFLSERMKVLNNVFISLIGLFVSGILIWYGFTTMMDILARDIRSLSVLQIPQAYVIVIIPLGSLLMFLEFTRMLYRSVSATKEQSHTVSM
ncbi:TRAP transporter small permease [Ammoniphilus sp. CFH 90114]|uniref:TRAP transporter small permease n=1 Tax=Ammoniphilus sp. CFH 90114 TaxID=2493665 RepID=UPI00100DF43D|nr:TRAP transporter small permease [Ammoniphilus sp. CFH 90114]RXT08038.1 TRAP transporter small permease [Ammoniphilus sp. CFH 90114]